MPEAATSGVLRKKVFKMSQNSQETPVPEETPVNFAKFLRTPLLQNNSRRLLLIWGYFNNKARDIFVVESWMHCFIALAKIPERERSISTSSFYGDLPGY